MGIILNHVFEVLNQESFPVIGTPPQALIFALCFTAAIFILYLFIDHLPKPTKNKITPKTEPVYTKAMISLWMIALLSATWDFWWHRAVGRDSFWVMPHILLYLSIISGIVLCFYIWRHSRDVIWKHIFFILLLAPVAGAFDNYFHTIWGVENLSKPLLVSWSPSHVLLALSATITSILLLKILLRYRRTNDFSFFGNICFAAILALIMFILLPFYPTGSWGQIAGFAGAGIISLVYIAILLSSEKIMQGRIDGTQVSIFIIVLFVMFYTKDIAPQVSVTPHDQAPIWLLVFSFIGTGVLLDVTKNRFPTWIRGLFAGVVWSGILFGFSTNFFSPQFQYGMTEIFTAISFSAIGGLVAGSIFGLFHLDDEKHIEKLLKKF